MAETTESAFTGISAESPPDPMVEPTPPPAPASRIDLIMNLHKLTKEELEAP